MTLSPGGGSWVRATQLPAPAFVPVQVASVPAPAQPEPLDRAWSKRSALDGNAFASRRLLLCRTAPPEITAAVPFGVPRSTGMACLAAFAALLIGLPLLARNAGAQVIAMFDAFFGHRGGGVRAAGALGLSAVERRGRGGRGHRARRARGDLTASPHARPTPLERFLIRLNRWGFPRLRFSDSRSVLAEEAGMDGSIIVGGSSGAGRGGNRGRSVA